MQRAVKRDPFFADQPPLSFLDDLKSPVHAEKPAGFGTRSIAPGEADVSGLYLDSGFPDPKGLLETIYDDFTKFLLVTDVFGMRIPVRIEMAQTPVFEAYRVTVTDDAVTVETADTEGARRALIWIEDELKRREGAFLPYGTIERTPHIHARITRCFFSPINRPPKYGDELSDDIDYYPDEYLNRIMHDGANGVWIYTRFSDLVESSYLTHYGKGREPRIEKLNRVIEKCARYGIGVYVFAIEPVALTAEEAEKYPEAAGAHSGWDGRRTFCTNTEFGKAFCEEAGRRLFESAPGLAGYISITYGERTTSCSSAYRHCDCPRCKDIAPGQVLAQAVDALTAGMKAASPSATLVSWTYGHRLWSFDDIREYVRNAPGGVALMQNFDDMGYEDQLGRMRLAVDYWLSYVGPSELFRITAEEAKAAGKTCFAKMQVCCSHEVASVPYVPVPGIIYKKYKAAHELGVTGVMQCWYFGNYPCLMSKAAGELAFEDFSRGEDAFLADLAAIYWGRSRAAVVVNAWRYFERAYRNYPMNVMFSYYGPMHDSVVWELQLLPKNFSLPRTWQTLDPIDGDRIAESLLNGHTLAEAITLTGRMVTFWNAGLREMNALSDLDAERRGQLSVAAALGILFSGGHDILEFYQYRDFLGRGQKPNEYLDAMRAIVGRAIRQSEAMTVLCEADGRLGYHSEGEGYKFFPKKLRSRIDQLKNLLETEFTEVQRRIDEGKAPLSYYEGVEPDVRHYQMSKTGIASAPWEPLSDGKSAFRVAYDDQAMTIELSSPESCNFILTPEFRLLWPDASAVIAPDATVTLEGNAFLYFSLFGEREKQNRERWHTETLPGDGTQLRVTLERRDIEWDGKLPMKLRVALDNRDNNGRGALWCVETDPVVTLGKSYVSPCEFGWLMP
ncbi:MAG: hypothetical protein VB111_08395 [Clostridiaceae bacterium]|nr:hypothetical protein [Clostridiaceae bacterium]